MYQVKGKNKKADMIFEKIQTKYNQQINYFEDRINFEINEAEKYKYDHMGKEDYSVQDRIRNLHKEQTFARQGLYYHADNYVNEKMSECVAIEDSRINRSMARVDKSGNVDRDYTYIKKEKVSDELEYDFREEVADYNYENASHGKRRRGKNDGAGSIIIRNRISPQVNGLELRLKAVEEFFGDKSSECLFVNEDVELRKKQVTRYFENCTVNDWVTEPRPYKFKTSKLDSLRSNSYFLSQRALVRHIHSSKVTTIKSGWLTPNVMSSNEWFRWFNRLKSAMFKNTHIVIDDTFYICFIIVVFMRINFSSFNHSLFVELFNIYSIFKKLENLFIYSYYVEKGELSGLFTLMLLIEKVWNFELKKSLDVDYNESRCWLESELPFQITKMVACCLYSLYMDVNVFCIFKVVSDFLKGDVINLDVKNANMRNRNSFMDLFIRLGAGFNYNDNVINCICSDNWQKYIRPTVEVIHNRRLPNGSTAYRSITKSSLWNFFYNDGVLDNTIFSEIVEQKTGYNIIVHELCDDLILSRLVNRTVTVHEYEIVADLKEICNPRELRIEYEMRPLPEIPLPEIHIGSTSDSSSTNTKHIKPLPAIPTLTELDFKEIGGDVHTLLYDLSWY